MLAAVTVATIVPAELLANYLAYLYGGPEVQTTPLNMSSSSNLKHSPQIRVNSPPKYDLLTSPQYEDKFPQMGNDITLTQQHITLT